MEKVLEKIKEIWGKIVDWWNKFDSKQKTTVIAIAFAVLLAFVGLYALLSNPNYTLLDQYEDAKTASDVVSILEENQIKYKTSDDGTRISVPKKDLSAANLALGSNGIVAPAYDIETALSGGFTVTEADKQLKYQRHLEDKLSRDIVATFAPIKAATVWIKLAENDGTLLSKKEESSCSITLTLDGEFGPDKAEYLAKSVAGALNFPNADKVVILDNEANLLYAGGEDTSIAGNASSQLGVKAEAESLMNNKINIVLVGTGQFGVVRVASNLDIDFSNTEKTHHEYTPAEGQSQGLLGEEEYYTSESSGGGGGVPGTDSNTETTYQYPDNSYSSSTIEEYYRKYLPTEDIEHTNIPSGVIRYANSSVAVSSINYILVKEDDVKKQGLLDGITWEEYKLANSEKRQIAVSDEMVTLVSNASGIAPERINIVAYEENAFSDSEGLPVDATDIIQIVLIILILALLAIVVIRSMRGEKTSEQPEELSVEGLLQSNPEPQLEDIELEEASETRKLIEKFVDENPEAVANLLRNWLNEEWG